MRAHTSFDWLKKSPEELCTAHNHSLVVIASMQMTKWKTKQGTLEERSCQPPHLHHKKTDEFTRISNKTREFQPNRLLNTAIHPSLSHCSKERCSGGKERLRAYFQKLSSCCVERALWVTTSPSSDSTYSPQHSLVCLYSYSSHPDHNVPTHPQEFCGAGHWNRHCPEEAAASTIQRQKGSLT